MTQSLEHHHGSVLDAVQYLPAFQTFAVRDRVQTRRLGPGTAPSVSNSNDFSFQNKGYLSPFLPEKIPVCV
jgi:hypothetical protein